MEISCFVSVAFFMFVSTYNVTDIGTFVSKLRYTYFLVSIVVNTYAFFSIDEMDTVGLEDLINVDLELENMMSLKSDFLYVGITVLTIIHTVSILWFTQKMNILYKCDRYITICTAFQAVLMKNMVTKRIKWIQVKEEKMANGLELLTTTRSILGFNEKVNNIFSLRMANVVVGGLLTFLHCMSAYWQVYGLHKEIDCYESNSALIALVVQGHIITELFCLGEKMSKISNCVSLYQYTRQLIVQIAKNF
ncbi:hypothetical protein J6590_065640 [Homalodisca vitripennis]|nr:hypothetical protein J6590_065640 [Homalodisca vitripennis]